MDDWQLVFDASEKVSDSYSAGAAVGVATMALLAVAVIIVTDSRRAGATSPRGKRLLATLAFALAFLCVWTSLWWFGTSREAEAVGIGIDVAPVAEGPVENFHPMPYTGHALESFDVQGVHFAYSDYVLTQGFNNTSSHGGPIRAGLQARIHYVRVAGHDYATIVRLEIRR